MKAVGAIATLGALTLLGGGAKGEVAMVRELWLAANVDDGFAEGQQQLYSSLSDRTSMVASSRSPQRFAAQSHGRFRLSLDWRELALTERRGEMVELRALGVAAGEGTIHRGSDQNEATVARGWVLDDAGTPIDLVASQGSLSRVPPVEWTAEGDGLSGDGLRWVVATPATAPEPRIDLSSTSTMGTGLDRLTGVHMMQSECPEPVPDGLVCYGTERIHLVGGQPDRWHRASRSRALLAEVGGKVEASLRHVPLGALRVGAPRSLALGGIGRWRVGLRVLLVRTLPGGAPPLGKNLEEARSVLLPELRAVNEIWGQCGIHIGRPEDVPIVVVDAPKAQSVTLGCGLGLPASGGGTISLRIGSRTVRIPTRAESSPVAAAMELAREVERVGYVAKVTPIPTQRVGALPIADVWIRSRNGSVPELSRVPDAPLSSDRALGVCLGRVDLSDGLSHFTDHLAGQGTLEERSLLGAIEDGDATTIEVFVVSEFAESTRLGESFIRADGSIPRNKVVVDAAGVASGFRTHVLAHELGHVLLDAGGHLDDYGVDRPWSLMDSDATGVGVFGPLRLSVEECARAHRQSGSDDHAGLLKPWPLQGTASRQ